jgi:hypothetical protein
MASGNRKRRRQQTGASDSSRLADQVQDHAGKANLHWHF